MPRPKTPDETPKAESPAQPAPVEVPLRTYTVLIGGHDRAILARDEKDLQEKIAALQAALSASSPS